MKKSYNWLLAAILLLVTTSTALAQITGTVVDASTQTPVPGVNVGVKATTIGTVTDFDGNFSLTIDEPGTLVISYVGFQTQEIELEGTTVDLGTIALEVSQVGLAEVQIIASVAVNRKTPVAVSTISAADIEAKLGNQEFPELLNTTPGVYATKAGGGYGDAELRLRGFNSENIAVMINGVPVNDMEGGRVYWSNWAGLSDVTRTMQVQRGLGASRVAVPSIGGTVNILTKTTDVEKGGSVFMNTGNDGYQKYGFTLSTGLDDSGFAATISASKTSGDGFVDGNWFEGYSYFVNISKEINKNHRLSLTAFGAPQEHGQRFEAEKIAVYRQSDRGIRFNRDFGYRNGEVYNASTNAYHKPQVSLNHFWNISEDMDLSTVVYGSLGTGGGRYLYGEDKTGIDNTEYRFGPLQPLNYDKIVQENIDRGALGAESIIIESRNDHTWFGALSTLSMDITEDIELIAGVDWRSYEGRHYQKVADLLGGSYWLDDDGNANNPNNVAQKGDKINYNNDGLVNWLGGFAQAEYSNDILSAFVNVALSNTGYKRIDYFRYLDTDPMRESDWVNFLGYSAKGGANYNINDQHNVFANVGYFEKAPFMNAVFLNNENIINENAENQKVVSAELGYGFRSQALSGTVNVYWTNWKDRTLTRSFPNPDGTRGFANILGINALHQGIELDFKYRASDALEITGMASVGDWRWQDDVTGVEIINEEGEVEDIIDIYIEDLKVGNAAQTSMALGANYEVLPDLRLRGNWNYFSDLYADFNPNDRTSPDSGQAWEVPAYGVVDTGLTYSFDFGGFDATLNGNVNNLFDTLYIADARDLDGTASGAGVWYGYGRTYTFGLKLNF
ncbi:MAG TPA: TonB-dependent receptor [Salinimicrobium sp.]|nr:TonB-dependent receptor [Salinimicrobium sp.]